MTDFDQIVELARDLTPMDGGFRVKLSDDGRHHIDVLAMIFNWRVVTTPVNSPDVYDRGWCYFGTGPQSFTRAVLAALAWDGADDTEPAGYSKRVGAG